MATNLLRTYNELLELIYLTESDNLSSIRRVFNRDFIENIPLAHRGKNVLPTPNENGEDVMDILFRHLTTKVVDEKSKKRSLDMARAVRIHWIRHHLLEVIPENLEVSYVEDEKRLYLLDTVERYVVILEPLRDNISLYLLTAYSLEDSNYRKIKKKIEKKRYKPLKQKTLSIMRKRPPNSFIHVKQVCPTYWNNESRVKGKAFVYFYTSFLHNYFKQNKFFTCFKLKRCPLFWISILIISYLVSIQDVYKYRKLKKQNPRIK